MGVSGASPHCLSPGVFKRSPSSSSSCPDKPNLLLAGVPSSAFFLEYDVAAVVGGEGVESWADEGAVVPDDVDGTRKPLAGVDNPEPSDPSERSGIDPMD